MHHFEDSQGSLHAEGGPLTRLAHEVGTPTYVYSRAALLERFEWLRRGLEAIHPLICYSVKANSHLRVLRLLRQAGISKVLLVTHAWHMPRAQWSFEANGIDVVPAPTGFTPPAQWKLRDLIAGAHSLHESAYAVHEWSGRLWYGLSY